MVDWGGIFVKELTQSQKDILLALPGGGNVLYNGGFRFAQRVDPFAFTTFNKPGSSPNFWAYAADRWAMSNENASLQFQRVDTAGGSEANLFARHYGQFKKITSTGKAAVFQIIQGMDTIPLRGRTVRFQMKMKYSVASSMTVRLGLLYSGGAAQDRITQGSSFISAWGAPGTDPTYPFLIALPPILADGGFIDGLGMDCILTSSWVRYSATFNIPSGAYNIIPIIWTENQLAPNDILNMSEAVLAFGEGISNWIPRPDPQELALVQRFYAKSFAIEQVPIQDLMLGVISNPTFSNFFTWGSIGTGSYATRSPKVMFPVRMMESQFGVLGALVHPVITLYNPAAANAQAAAVSAGDCSSTTAEYIDQDGFSIKAVTPGGIAVGEAIAVHWTADQEMYQ